MLRVLTIAAILGALAISGVASAGDAAKGEKGLPEVQGVSHR